MPQDRTLGRSAAREGCAPAALRSGRRASILLPLSKAPSAAPRVLVVDDDRASADIAVLLLEELGHEARAAYDGTSAIAAAQAWRPDVVLVDLRLPGVDGFEVARAIRSDPQTSAARLVALTGMSDDESKVAALRAGFDAHVVKGLALSEMMEVLSVAVRHDPA